MTALFIERKSPALHRARIPKYSPVLAADMAGPAVSSFIAIASRWEMRPDSTPATVSPMTTDSFVSCKSTGRIGDVQDWMASHGLPLCRLQITFRT